MLRDDTSVINDLDFQFSQKVFYTVPLMRTFIVDSTKLYFDWDACNPECVDAICPEAKPDCDGHMLLNTIYTHKDKFEFEKP